MECGTPTAPAKVEYPPNTARPQVPAFLMGVVGITALDSDGAAAVEHALRGVLDGLRMPPGSPVAAALPLALGLGPRTPIMLLTTGAPGSEERFVQLAPGRNIHVLPVLPVALDTYVQRSYFQGSDGQRAAEQLRRLDPSFVVRTSSSSTVDNEAQELAAAEYVALHAQLLVVITDQAASTDRDRLPAVVRDAKLNGRWSAPIKGMTALPWVESGPVLELAIGPRPAAGRAPTVAVHWHAPTDTLDVAAALRGLRQQAYWLDLFHAHDLGPSERVLCDEEAESIFRKDRGHGVQSDNSVPDASGTVVKPGMFASVGYGALPPELKADVHRLAYARRWISIVNRRCDARVKRQQRLAIGLGVLVVTGSALYENLVPARYETDPSVVSPVLVSVLIAAVLMVFAALLVHRWFRRSGVLEQQDDLRALSEGLRVQLFWDLAGIGNGVASHYMVRGRDELGWIRDALRSLTLPGWPAHAALRAMPLEHQFSLVRWVSRQWLQEQEYYFRSALSRIQHNDRALGMRRDIALWCACWLTGLQAGLVHTSFGARFNTWAEQASARPFLWLSVLALALVVVRSAWVVVLRSAGPLAVPRSAAGATPHVRAVVEQSPMLKPLLGLLIALVCLVAAGELSSYWDIVPVPARELAVLRNLALALAGAAQLLRGMRFHAENIRRYAGMLALFRNAGVHADGLVNGNGTKEADLVCARALLFEVGREALNENAEWLGMHRDRPVEPVLPS